MTEIIFFICKEFTSEHISSSKSLVKCPVWSSSTEDSSPGIRNIKSDDQKGISIELVNMSYQSLVLVFKNDRATEVSHQSKKNAFDRTTVVFKTKQVKECSVLPSSLGKMPFSSLSFLLSTKHWTELKTTWIASSTCSEKSSTNPSPDVDSSMKIIVEKLKGKGFGFNNGEMDG